MAAKKKKPYEIGELDQYLFGQGNHYEIYKKLGSHCVKNWETGRGILCKYGRHMQNLFPSSRRV